MRELQFKIVTGLTNAHLKAFVGLTQQQKLALTHRNEKTGKGFDWRSVFELNARSPSIASDELSHINIPGLTRDLFGGLENIEK